MSWDSPRALSKAKEALTALGYEGSSVELIMELWLGTRLSFAEILGSDWDEILRDGITRARQGAGGDWRAESLHPQLSLPRAASASRCA